jgi:hypothetical protein
VILGTYVNCVNCGGIVMEDLECNLELPPHPIHIRQSQRFLVTPSSPLTWACNFLFKAETVIFKSPIGRLSGSTQKLLISKVAHFKHFNS